MEKRTTANLGTAPAERATAEKPTPRQATDTVSPAGAGKPPAEAREHPGLSRSTWGHVAFWTGLGAGVFGAVAAGLAAKAGDDYHAGNLDAYSTSTTWAGCMYAGLAVGATLMTTGVLLWLLAPGEDGSAADAAVSAVPVPEGGVVFSLGGRF